MCVRKLDKKESDDTNVGRTGFNRSWLRIPMGSETITIIIITVIAYSGGFDITSQGFFSKTCE